MKLPALIKPKKKLSAAATRRSRSLGMPEEMDYEEMSEPNMKLSRALLIVLVLHIVAVAGIVAFNTIKTRESLSPAPAETQVSAEASAAPSLAPVAAPAAAVPNELAKATAQSETKSAPAAAKPAAPAPASGVKDSGRIYTVVRGDNPVTIARHLKVSEADLLELNQITDPRRLQINQKLKIPESHPANSSKHSSD